MRAELERHRTPSHVSRLVTEPTSNHASSPETRLRRATDRLRGGPEAPGGAGRDAVGYEAKGLSVVEVLRVGVSSAVSGIEPAASAGEAVMGKTPPPSSTALRPAVSARRPRIGSLP